jgi:hypothetical protein
VCILLAITAYVVISTPPNTSLKLTAAGFSHAGGRG